MLEVPLEWKKVLDLMMEEENILLEDTGPNKQRRDLISQGRRKRRKEDNIWPEKGGHSPTVSWRIQHPEGFYFEDWDKGKQEEDYRQAPDKFQKISQMVLRNRALEIHPVGDRVLSSLRVQHQGG